MSALAWPERGIDKKRFVEIITKFPPDKLDPSMISVPLLTEYSDIWKQRLPVTNKALYLTTNTVDKAESEILGLFPSDNTSHLRAEVRKYSYACLLYEQVRCGFVHEYMIGKCASDSDQLRKILGVGEDQISYVNCIDNVGTLNRRIHYSIECISEMAKSVAHGLDCVCSQQNIPIFQGLDLTTPTSWWIEGNSITT